MLELRTKQSAKLFWILTVMAGMFQCQDSIPVDLWESPLSDEEADDDDLLTLTKVNPISSVKTDKTMLSWQEEFDVGGQSFVAIKKK